MKTNKQFEQYRELNIKMHKASRDLGKSSLELECIECIGKKEEKITVRQMYEYLSHLSRSSVSRANSQLIRAGIVAGEINPNEGERRNSFLSLTNNGKEVYKTLLSYFS